MLYVTMCYADSSWRWEPQLKMLYFCFIAGKFIDFEQKMIIYNWGKKPEFSLDLMRAFLKYRHFWETRFTLNG